MKPKSKTTPLWKGITSTFAEHHGDEYALGTLPDQQHQIIETFEQRLEDNQKPEEWKRKLMEALKGNG